MNCSMIVSWLASTALRRLRHRRRRAASRRPWSPRRRRPPPAPAPEADLRRRSASTTAGMDTHRPAGRQLLPICQRHLGEEHADPGRQVELRHVHRARRSVARAHRDADRRGREGSRTARSATPMPASWTRPRSRRRAWRRSSRGSTKFAASRARPSLPRSTREADRNRHRHARSAASSARTTRSRTSYVLNFVPGRPRHARPRLLSVEPTPSSLETRAHISQHLTKMLTLAGEANAAARAKAILDFETEIAKVQLDPASTAATRPRPTTR